MKKIIIIISRCLYAVQCAQGMRSECVQQFCYVEPSVREFFFPSCQGQAFDLHKKTSTQGSKIKMFFLSGTGF